MFATIFETSSQTTENEHGRSEQHHLSLIPSLQLMMIKDNKGFKQTDLNISSSMTSSDLATQTSQRKTWAHTKWQVKVRLTEG